MQALLGQRGLGGAMGMGGGDMQQYDTAETIHVSSLALLKMLKHGRAGVPMEVMGLMLGTLVDDYTITVKDVFAMPQSGTSVSVESVDPVFQQQMVDMLNQTGRRENVVGWYHSHPGFGCWLSGVDINTQQSFEAISARSVAVVVDPIQSVKGKVVIDAFRLINPQMLMFGIEPRQTTSIVGHLNKPSITALVHGLNRHYYSMVINYRRDKLEERMLASLRKSRWTSGLEITDYHKHAADNLESLKQLAELSKVYATNVRDEKDVPIKELELKQVGKVNAKRRLEDEVQRHLSRSIVQTLSSVVDTVVF